VSASLPTAALLRQQAEWLAPMRARLLRRVAIARRASVLDLGAGYGAVSHELARRASGQVVALDLALAPLLTIPAAPATPDYDTPADAVRCVCADGSCLPFPNAAFDLVFCQCFLMWAAAPAGVVAEVGRVVQPGGVFVAIEPDYGGMIEHPPAIATRELWLAALERAGATPHAGRMLPGWLEVCGFEVQVDLLPGMLPPSSARFEFLRGLPLTRKERAALRRIEKKDRALGETWQRIAHLPFIMVTGTR
jgi:SAM-dependent methyltransferase